MQFTPEQVKSFKDLYRNKFGIDLSEEEALEQLTKLVNLVKITYRPITIDEYLTTKIKQHENRTK
jgi:hypothetical protein